MASVRNAQQAHAKEMLEVALGKNMVPFDELSQADADEFLRETLADVDLRELRGFKPLKDLLTFRSGNVIPHTLNLEALDLSPKVSLEVIDLIPEDPLDNFVVDLNTHFITLSRVDFNRKVVFKRNESDEETDDWDIADSWGKSAYRYRGSGSILALRRPRNHTGAENNLFVISYWYKKIPLEETYAIWNIKVARILLEGMRFHFGLLYAKIAVELVWELRDAYGRTVNELESQLAYLRGKAAEFERRADAVSYEVE
jgi:hypothetical protein